MRRHQQGSIVTLLALLLLCGDTLAQLVTGSISGSVTDASGGAVAGAKVTVINERTGEARAAQSNDAGAFNFPALQPSAYTIKVERQGFRSLERKNLVLTANDKLSLGDLELQVGQVTEVLQVTAEGSLVKTASSENSALLSATQLDLQQAKGRDVVSLLRVLPGVSYQAGQTGQTFDSDSLGGTYGTFTPNISGTRSRWNTFTLDGQTGSDADIVEAFNGSTSMDAIEEVKVLFNNYQAEFGRNTGGTVNIVSKSGTRDFHGSVYWYKRHEQFNANDFFNNRTGLAKPLYRYNTLGGTIGGPIFIPGKFNKNRDKLFFFYSREDWRVREPRIPRQVTMPTELERNGDFSQSLDVNGQLILIKDPSKTSLPCTTADRRGCFPDNKVPADIINRNRNGQAILNLFPLPNRTDRSLTLGNYNYVFQEITELPKKQNLLKVDYKPTEKDTISVRGRTWWSDRRGYEGLAAFNSNWDQLFHHYLFTEDSLQGSYTRIISPTLVNEFAATYRVLGEIGAAVGDNDFDPVIRAKRGITLSQFNPGLNPLGFIPNASFGGVPGTAPTITYDGRTPIDAGDVRFTFVNNLSWTKGSHAFKFGTYIERNFASEGPRSNFGGSFNFGRDPNNPLESGYAFANALLGNFQNYTESSARTTGRGKNYLFDFFAQDTWKIKRLTLDYGMRFSYFSPWRLRDREGAGFALDHYDRSKAPVLYLPGCDVNTTPCPNDALRARNPLNNELLPRYFIGAYVPDTGNVINGMVLATDESYPDGFRKQEPLQLGPRFGFAYDLFGDGKTAIRGGFGVTKQTIPSSGNFLGGLNSNPPLQFNPQVFYGNFDTFLNSSTVLFPGGVLAHELDNKTPSVYNYSLSIQRDIGFNTVVEVSYVGNVGRHLIMQRNLNTVPYGARFLPQNADPTAPTRALNDNFFRPFPGYGDIIYVEHSGTSNYNALQTSLNRRFSRGFQFGVAYTWSKTMDYGSADRSGLPLYRPYRVWSYGEASFDQTHVFVFNYTWDLPKASRVWDNRFTRIVFDNWQLSGVTAFVSGTPLGVTFSTTDNADISGGGDGSRLNLIAKAQLGGGDRSFDRWFNTAAFDRPARGDFGSAPRNVARGPGSNNWDISLFKNIPVKSEKRYFQFRWEVYNLFNHTQFQSVDTDARFDPAGNQVDTRFGQVIATRPPRVMQFALSFKF